jgi:hypothetical protein
LLLFADDIAILGNSPEEINTSLVLLYSYCTKWSLEVNVNGTKVLVFRKIGALLSSKNILYNDKHQEVVNDSIIDIQFLTILVILYRNNLLVNL